VNPAQATPSGVATTVVEDRRGVRVLLFESEWQLNYFISQHPEVLLQAESGNWIIG
jgi:peptide subunit release factor RF-3